MRCSASLSSLIERTTERVQQVSGRVSLRVHCSSVWRCATVDDGAPFDVAGQFLLVVLPDEVFESAHALLWADLVRSG